MSNKHVAIVGLFREGKRQCEIFRLLNVPQQIVSDAIRHFNELDHTGQRPGRDRSSPSTLLARQNHQEADTAKFEALHEENRS